MAEPTADKPQAEEADFGRPRCTCPPIDGYVIVRKGCPHHAGRRADAVEAEPSRDPEADEMACAWTDYRDDYGIHPSDMTVAFKAFEAGWKAGREGDQSGVLR